MPKRQGGARDTNGCDRRTGTKKRKGTKERMGEILFFVGDDK
jgi:hypothetical protein